MTITIQVSKVRSVWPTSWQKGLASPEKSTHVYQSTHCRHKLLPLIIRQVWRAEVPGGEALQVCFYLFFYFTKSNQKWFLHNNQRTSRQTTENKKTKNNNHTTGKEGFFFFQFERLYLLNSPPGGAVDLIIGAKELGQKLIMNGRVIAVISMCLQSARSTSERGSCPAGTPSDERPRWLMSCGPSDWGSHKP